MNEIDAKSRAARIPSAMVDLSSRPFRVLREMLRAKWSYADVYRNPGPIQFQGSTRWSVPHTLQMQQGDYLNDVECVYENLSEIQSLVCPGIASPQQIAVTLAQTRAILETLRSVTFNSQNGFF